MGKHSEEFTDQYGVTYKPEDFADFDHGDDEVGPGGIINTPEEDWPEGWEPNDEMSPAVEADKKED